MSTTVTRPLVAHLAAITAVLVATACSPGSEDTPTGAGAASAPAASSTSPVPQALPVEPGAPSAPGSPGGPDGPLAPLDDLRDHTSSSPKPGAGRDAVQAARLVVSTWAHPELLAEEWWADLEPLLSTSAREAYGYTDPSVIPDLQVTSARVVPALSSGQTFAVVDVRTSLGVVRVNLTRASAKSGWVMDRMDLAEVLGGPPPPESHPDDQPAAEPVRQD